MFWVSIIVSFPLWVKDEVAPFQILFIEHFDAASVRHQQKAFFLVEIHASSHDPRYYTRVESVVEQLNGEHLPAVHPFEESLHAHAHPNCLDQFYLLWCPFNYSLVQGSRLRTNQHFLHHRLIARNSQPLPPHFAQPKSDTLENRLPTKHINTLANLLRISVHASCVQDSFEVGGGGVYVPGEDQEVVGCKVHHQV